jgi:hypothetical protein
MCTVKNLQNIYRKPIFKIMVFKNFSSHDSIPLTVEVSYSTHGHKLKALTNMQDCCIGNIRGASMLSRERLGE